MASGVRNGNRLHPESRPRGQKHGRSKLTESQVHEVREKANKGIFQYVIAQEYGVDRSTIGLIVRRKNWQHI